MSVAVVAGRVVLCKIQRAMISASDCTNQQARTRHWAALSVACVPTGRAPCSSPLLSTSPRVGFNPCPPRLQSTARGAAPTSASAWASARRAQQRKAVRSMALVGSGLGQRLRSSRAKKMPYGCLPMRPVPQKRDPWQRGEASWGGAAARGKLSHVSFNGTRRASPGKQPVSELTITQRL